MLLTDNPLLYTDSYKYSHWAQYPEGMTALEAYAESRGSEHGYSVVFGLQYFLKRYFSQPFTLEQIEQAAEVAGQHFGRTDVCPKEAFKYIRNLYNGFYPVQIDAVPEGSVIPQLNILMRVRSTDQRVPWIVSFLETQLLRALWYGTTVATNSFAAKRIIKEFLDRTADEPDAELPFKLHDFGARGVSSHESAMIGGAAHLLNFAGTDTLEGLGMLADYYNGGIAGYSIPATEHSTITAWGRANESAAFRNMLAKFGTKGNLFACVSDSYDIYNAVSELWGSQLLAEVQASGSMLVVRPDSGEPSEVVLDVVERLGRTYGSRVNEKGFKVLENVRVIQGDGVNLQSIRQILEALTQYGWSASNVAFGMGGALLQRVDRDTQKFAYKACLATIDGKEVEIYKDPITASFKKSKRGRLELRRNPDNSYETINLLEHPELAGEVDELQPLWKNGALLREDNLDTIRYRTNTALDEMMYPTIPRIYAQDPIIA